MLLLLQQISISSDLEFNCVFNMITMINLIALKHKNNNMKTKTQTWRNKSTKRQTGTLGHEHKRIKLQKYFTALWYWKLRQAGQCWWWRVCYLSFAGRTPRALNSDSVVVIIWGMFRPCPCPTSSTLSTGAWPGPPPQLPEDQTRKTVGQLRHNKRRQWQHTLPASLSSQCHGHQHNFNCWRDGKKWYQFIYYYVRACWPK